PRAKDKFSDTALFIKKTFGALVATNFVKEVHQTVRYIRNNPGIGAVERYLEGAPVLYRSIVVQRLNKIIYWENGNVIEIVDFWDCRREPIAQAAHLK
ncbi:MAG: type II toxin-antitoxin system RelE/ParE family toxin, partial [Bacteroidales bacterium]|nr:type II toxin-antitoxin system RelE/ParE family toxin [Bacteroidales bacterium]